jgi:hypothetical protein
VAVAAAKQFPPLPARDLARLRESGISANVARTRGYRAAVSKAELGRLGFSRRQQLTPGLLIPIHDVDGQIRGHQLRPHEPRTDANGRVVKYETPGGARNVIDVPPRARKRLSDPTCPLFVTEGAFKADAAVSRGLCCIALLGVYGWRGTNQDGGKAALADWESIALNDRKVCVVFDSDVHSNKQVRQALRRLRAFLKRRGARVQIVLLPPGPDGEKTGLDDFFAAGGNVDQLLELASNELPADETPDLPYRQTKAGLVWDKPTRDGTTVVPLTSFNAQIVADVTEDDGAERRRVFEIEAGVNGDSSRFAVTAHQFELMHWPVEQLGAGALVYPSGNREHARAAIQLLSGPEQRCIYTHTGFRTLGEYYGFLHAGGAIGPDGPLPGIQVALPDALGTLSLPEPPVGKQLHRAIRASLRLLELAEDELTIPSLSAVYRAPLGGTDFSVHLVGPTGAGKTVFAALLQQHYGPGLNARKLPGSWISTANSLEGLTFVAKDAVLVIDDFAPEGTQVDIARAHKEAARLFRAQGNQAGRQRMRPDGTLRPDRRPRALIISTGEDVPRGHSVRARALILEIGPNSLDWDRVTAAQADADNGLYAQALSAYLSWIARTYEQIQRRLQEELPRLRQAQQDERHRRTPEIIANLTIGITLFLEFACDCGAITQAEAYIHLQRAREALARAADLQSDHHQTADPCLRFFELLKAALTSGNAHLASCQGTTPKHANALGWREQYGDKHPQGDRIGWIDEDNVYLEPELAFTAAQRIARDAGDPITISSQTLAKRLNERGYLLTTDTERGRLRIRKRIDGERRSVLHLHTNSLIDQDTAQPTQTAHPPPAAAASDTKKRARKAMPTRTEPTSNQRPVSGTRHRTRPKEDRG